MTANHYKKKKKATGTRTSGGGGVARTLASMLDGTFFSEKTNMHAMRFILYVSALALFLIFNAYYAERKVREVEQLRHETTELRIIYVQTRSDYMFLTRQSEMARRLKAEGFIDPVEPPKPILPPQRKNVWDRLLGWIR